MTPESVFGVVFVLQADAGDCDRAEIDLVTHAFHAIVADFFGIQVAAVTFTSAVAKFPVIEQAFFLFHVQSPPL